MDSETMNIPVIDFSKNPKHEIGAQIREAVEEYGCFVAIFDEFPLHLRKSLLDGLEQIFYLPKEIKLRSKTKDPYEGYVAQHAMGPFFESFGIDDVLTPPNIERFTTLLWSHGNPSFSKIVESILEHLSELDKIVRKLVVESLGLEKYMNEHMDSSKYLFRVQKYYNGIGINESNQSHEINKLALKSHTDKNFVTILCQINEVNGLQIQTKNGDWITAQPSPNSFIVLMGDSFHAWTNGRVHSPYHRVVAVGDEARYSVGLFSIPKVGYKIKAPEEMVDKEQPSLFKAFEYRPFLDFYFSKAGRASPDALKEYCGV